MHCWEASQRGTFWHTARGRACGRSLWCCIWSAPFLCPALCKSSALVMSLDLFSSTLLMPPLWFPMHVWGVLVLAPVACLARLCSQALHDYSGITHLWGFILQRLFDYCLCCLPGYLFEAHRSLFVQEWAAQHAMLCKAVRA